VVKIEGKELSTFSETHTALLLAAHGFKEKWRSLKWLCDFAEFVRSHRGIDWEWVAGRTQRMGQFRALLATVLLSAEWLDAPVPANLLSRAQGDATVRMFAEDAGRRLASSRNEGPGKAFMRELAADERLAHRVLRVATHLTTRTVGDYEAMPLPPALWPVYHLTRPFRLAFMGARALLTRRRDPASPDAAAPP
jgi:hypothetical protein